MSEAAVQVTGLRRLRPDGARLLDGLDLVVPGGQWASIYGPSGGGKTTLLSILGGLDGAFEGEVEILGRKLAGTSDDERTLMRRREIGFVFQSFHLLEELSVRENLTVPLWLSPVDRPGDAIARVVEQVGLSDRIDVKVRGLSGGERQRVAVARALIHGPRLLLADEPTGNLDDATAERILDLFAELRRARPELSIVMVTHDPKVLERSDATWFLRDGRLEAQG